VRFVDERCGLAEVIFRELFGNDVSRRVLLSFAVDERFLIDDDGRIGVARPLPKRFLLGFNLIKITNQ
jgi:hypothetical protein